MFKFNFKDEVNKVKQKALLPFIDKFLPIILNQVHRIQKLKKDGGLRQVGEDAIVITIVSHNEQVLLNLHPVVYNEQIQEMVMKKPIRSDNINDILTHGFQFEQLEELDEVPLTNSELEAPKDEEE